MAILSMLPPTRIADVASLSRRERAVLDHMSRGMSNNGISQQLFLSPKTIEAHIGTIFAKLGLQPEQGENRRVTAVLIWLAAAEIV